MESNGIQGIVNEVNLNYTKIAEFDGVEAIIPNASVYNSAIKKFTHKKYKEYNRPKKKDFDKKKQYREYIKMINKLLSSGIKSVSLSIDIPDFCFLSGMPSLLSIRRESFSRNRDE